MNESMINLPPTPNSPAIAVKVERSAKLRSMRIIIDVRKKVFLRIPLKSCGKKLMSLI